MAEKPPAGFLEIVEVEKKTDQQAYSLIGLCVDFLEPTQSRGTDLTMKMRLWDTSCRGSHDLASDGMELRCFYRDNKDFPPIQDVGDVVIVHNIKTWTRGSQRFGISSNLTTWTIISGPSLLSNADSNLSVVQVRHPLGAKQKPSATPAELNYAKTLVEAKDLSGIRVPPKGVSLDTTAVLTGTTRSPTLSRHKFRVIRDIRPPFEVAGLQFVDLVGEVRRVYSGLGNPVEMQLTDYTEHPQLYNYEDNHGANMQNSSWPGPWGMMTITINAWDQHGEYVMDKVRDAEIDLGTYVRVTNVQIKMDKHGSLMQGHLRGGGSNAGTNVTILASKDAEHILELRELLTRRREYNTDRKAKAIGFVQDAPNAKRAREEDRPQKMTEQPKKKSKSALQREKRRLEKEKAKANEQMVQSNDNQAKKAKIQSNQHVRCETVSAKLTTISSIMQGDSLDRTTPSGNPYRLPFQNCKYKSKVQVIDFFPDSLADFASPYRTSDYEALSDYDSGHDEDATLEHARRNEEKVKWKWHFFIMVRDPTSAQLLPKEYQAEGERMDPPALPVQVTGQDGDYLLNMVASNLHDNLGDLARLKEKLFVLWGDLEEKKSETGRTGLELARDKSVVISSKPFECLIKEFGVSAVDDTGNVLSQKWERMWKIFGTNIG